MPKVAATRKVAAKPAAAKTASAAPAEKPKLSRHQNFVRLANRRVRKVLKAIDQIGNLSSANYEYSEAEVDKLAEVLSGALQKAIDRFSPREKTKKAEVDDLFADSEAGE